MTARMRRLAADFEQIKKDFANHKNIRVTPLGDQPPEKYHVTYFVNGIYLLPDGRVETLSRHEVEITLHADYPRYKPVCKILTPIWHPNFRDGQICIGDIWGAGESLSDIIINIGDMIQYKSWNSYSPLSADAAQWAIENRHMFPVGNVNLHIADYASAKDTVDIDLLEESSTAPNASPISPLPPTVALGADTDRTVALSSPASFDPPSPPQTENDFEITPEELVGVEFVPTAQRMQTMSRAAVAKGGKVNFKTVLVKGLIWALIGAFLGFFVSEITKADDTEPLIANLMGHPILAQYYEDFNRAIDLYDKDQNAGIRYYSKSQDSLYDSYKHEFNSDEDALSEALKTCVRGSTAIWSGVIALFIGLSLGIGEGVYYGSAGKAVKYALIGAGASLGMGLASGYIAQWMYSAMLSDDPEKIAAAFVRGVGWAVMGLGIGVAIGLIKPSGKRILFCSLGGMAGAFLGGFLFNFICEIIPNDVVARGVAIVTMGCLIGVGVGLLEQFAKTAWLKVIRGEFEGKEYLVFAGTTSIGSNGKNTIVLFKDKLVGPHHCDIILEGSKYVLVDCGTPLGTVVNAMKTNRHVLRQGDAISIGNSVLVFNTK